MKIEQVVLRQLKMPLISPFETSFGREEDREFIIVEVSSEGLTGYAEVPVMSAPLYNEETVQTAWHVLEDFLIPAVIGREIERPEAVPEIFRPIRRHNMAKSGLEGAVWDLHARQQGVPLAKALGGDKDRIAVGVSIGIQENIPALLDTVERFLQQGYRRIKIKIKPGWDVEPVAAIRKTFGPVPLMADANSAYSLDDLSILARLDDFDLLMIEQPLAHDDIIDHAKLQAKLNTPICLDESIHSAADARKAIELGSCRVINIKVARVGGLTEARRVHDVCQERGVPVWCGGMLESGIGRAHNIAITTLPNFTLPGDTSASARYWAEDIIQPEVIMTPDGYIEVPAAPGLGYRPVPERIRRYQVREAVFRPA